MRIGRRVLRARSCPVALAAGGLVLGLDRCLASWSTSSAAVVLVDVVRGWPRGSGGVERAWVAV
ncbi:hypothetical protein [Saccharothrix texasensis]|uniref:hypothetical protein n=1 Tax=Saccharothrix texasensis TaxID=103734 RepID=UPI0011CD6422|nr:hypothetical protein [Saccharothrix texasensis]